MARTHDRRQETDPWRGHPVERLRHAINAGEIDPVRDLLAKGLDVGPSRDFPQNLTRDGDRQMTDPLAICCHLLCLMTGDGWARQSVDRWAGIAHLLIDHGASLMRPDTEMDITPMEALVVLEVHDEGALDQGSLQTLAGVWARMDENPIEGVSGSVAGEGSMMERARKAIPGFSRVPGRLRQVMEAISQEKQMLGQVAQVAQAGPGPRL